MCSEGEPHQGNSNNYQYSQRSPNRLLVSTAVSQPLQRSPNRLLLSTGVSQPPIGIHSGPPTAHRYLQRSPKPLTGTIVLSALPSLHALLLELFVLLLQHKCSSDLRHNCEDAEGPPTMLRSVLVARSVLRIRRLIDRTARSGAPMRRRLGSQWPSTCQTAATTTRVTGRCSR